MKNKFTVEEEIKILKLIREFNDQELNEAFLGKRFKKWFSDVNLVPSGVRNFFKNYNKIESQINFLDDEFELAIKLVKEFFNNTKTDILTDDDSKKDFEEAKKYITTTNRIEGVDKVLKSTAVIEKLKEIKMNSSFLPAIIKIQVYVKMLDYIEIGKYEDEIAKLFKNKDDFEPTSIAKINTLIVEFTENISAVLTTINESKEIKEISKIVNGMIKIKEPDIKNKYLKTLAFLVNAEKIINIPADPESAKTPPTPGGEEKKEENKYKNKQVALWELKKGEIFYVTNKMLEEKIKSKGKVGWKGDEYTINKSGANIQFWLEGNKETRVVFKPGKLINSGDKTLKELIFIESIGIE